MAKTWETPAWGQDRNDVRGPSTAPPARGPLVVATERPGTRRMALAGLGWVLSLPGSSEASNFAIQLSKSQVQAFPWQREPVPGPLLPGYLWPQALWPHNVGWGTGSQIRALPSVTAWDGPPPPLCTPVPPSFLCLAQSLAFIPPAGHTYTHTPL